MNNFKERELDRILEQETLVFELGNELIEKLKRNFNKTYERYLNREFEIENEDGILWSASKVEGFPSSSRYDNAKLDLDYYFNLREFSGSNLDIDEDELSKIKEKIKSIQDKIRSNEYDKKMLDYIEKELEKEDFIMELSYSSTWEIISVVGVEVIVPAISIGKRVNNI